MDPMVRWVTIHPLLAHFTIGGLPLIVIGYGLGWWRRSLAWTRVGDAALGVTATLTVATLAFGLVADQRVGWPGGLERWRSLHLWLGVATTTLLALTALARLWAWRQAAAGAAAASPALVTAVLVASALAGATGWIGGEVLVFHSGMAVRAAGDGSLAPPLGKPGAPPRDFLAAMREARAAWGGIEAQLARTLVQEPRPELLQGMAADALRLRRAAEAMAESGGRDGNAKRAEQLATMSQALRGDALDLEEAAKKGNLQDLAHALGEASGHCADCHEELRWAKPQRLTAK
jgi:uncharacterized membrane protein